MGYTENINSILKWGNAFQRQFGIPLDRSSLHSSYADAVAYAKGDGSDERGLGKESYIGQIITVWGLNEKNVEGVWVYSLVPSEKEGYKAELKPVGAGAGTEIADNYSAAKLLSNDLVVGQLIKVTNDEEIDASGDSEDSDLEKITYKSGFYIVDAPGSISALDTSTGASDEIGAILTRIAALESDKVAKSDFETYQGTVTDALADKVNSGDFETYQSTVTDALAGKVDNSYKEEVTTALAGKVDNSYKEEVSTALAGKVDNSYKEEVTELLSGKVSGEDFETYQDTVTDALAGKVDNSYKEEVSTALAGKVDNSYKEEVTTALADKVNSGDFETYQGTVTDALAGKVDNSYKEEVTTALAGKVSGEDFETYQGTVTEALETKATVDALNTLEGRVDTDIQNLTTLTEKVDVDIQNLSNHLVDYSTQLGEVDDRLTTLEQFKTDHIQHNAIDESDIASLFGEKSE